MLKKPKNLKNLLLCIILDTKIPLTDAYKILEDEYRFLTDEPFSPSAYLESSENICFILELLGSIVRNTKNERAQIMLGHMLTRGIPPMHLSLNVPTNIDELYVLAGTPQVATRFSVPSGCARFFVYTDVHPCSHGMPIYKDFISCECCDKVDFLPEPDGTLLDSTLHTEHGYCYALGLEDTDIHGLKTWLARLYRITENAELSGLAPERTLADFLKWPRRYLFGPKLCRKVLQDLAAWLPLIKAENDADFLSIYRYFVEMFQTAGMSGVFGVESWDRPACSLITPNTRVMVPKEDADI